MCMHRKGRWLCRGISRIRKLAEARLRARSAKAALAASLAAFAALAAENDRLRVSRHNHSK